MNFTGQSVLVTGAGVGIGYEMCRRFALAGASVALNDLDGSLAERAAAQLNAEVGANRVAGYGFDVADVAAVRAVVAEVVAQTGRLDVLVANAGLTNYGPFLSTTPEAFDRLTAVNLRGSYFSAQAAALAMIERGIRGRILLLSSVTGVQAIANLGAYGITKAGIRMMARSLALELGPYGITVNAMCPGAISTERTLADDPQHDENWASVTPTGRPGSVGDIAATALFLASAEAAHITGQTLVIDGGWTLQSPLPTERPPEPMTRQ
jgi:3-oxoacyl-[acyl-carrier protein] reductase